MSDQLNIFSDTLLSEIAELEPDSKGTYLHFLMLCHSQGGSLKDEDGRIARMLGIHVNKWKKRRVELTAYIVPIDGRVTAIHLVNKSNKRGVTIKRKSDLGNPNTPPVTQGVTPIVTTLDTPHNTPLDTGVDTPLVTPPVDLEKPLNINTPVSSLTYARSNPNPNPTSTISTLEINNIPSKPISTLVVDDRKKVKNSYPPEFLEFWEPYPPTNCSKSEAYKSYKRALAKGIDHGTIVEGLGKYVEFLSATGATVAHPTTWLNQERWAVDYDAAAVQQRITSARSTPGSHESTWISEGDRLAAKYLAQSRGQSSPSPSPVPGLCAPEAIRQDPG
jgi:hypothetical protein